MPKKNITYFSYYLSKESFEQLENIALRYRNTKNYFYSRFSGIRSYKNLFFFRKNIRDVIIKEINEGKISFGLPARYWKQALNESVSNIKGNWSRALKETRKDVKNNSSLTDHQKHYLMYVMSIKEELHFVLNKEYHEVKDDRFRDIGQRKLNKYLRRIIRKNKSNIPYSRTALSFNVDADMYKQNDNRNISIQSLKKGRRIPIPLNTPHKFRKTIKVKIHSGFISISEAIDIKKKRNTGKDTIGIDKNYENVISTSGGNTYGEGINKLYNEYSDLIDNKYKKRNKVGAVMKKHLEKGNSKKARNIKRNNLGAGKIEKEKGRIKERFTSLINSSINEFIKKENPKDIILEDLTFKPKKSKNHKLHNWCKGYLQQRVEYKSQINNINIKEVNPAFTSQQCPHCHFFYDRRDVVHCPSCGRGVDSHVDSAKVILMRSLDKDIASWMRPNKVREILVQRNRRMSDESVGGSHHQHSPTVPSKTQESGHSVHSGSELPSSS